MQLGCWSQLLQHEQLICWQEVIEDYRWCSPPHDCQFRCPICKIGCLGWAVEKALYPWSFSLVLRFNFFKSNPCEFEAFGAQLAKDDHATFSSQGACSCMVLKAWKVGGESERESVRERVRESVRVSSYEQLWAAMSSYEQLWAAMSSYEQLWAAMSSYEQLSSEARFPHQFWPKLSTLKFVARCLWLASLQPMQSLLNCP